MNKNDDSPLSNVIPFSGVHGHASRWFRSLPKGDRKFLLSAVHELRSTLSRAGREREKALVEGLLRQLDEDHEAAKG